MPEAWGEPGVRMFGIETERVTRTVPVGSLAPSSITARHQPQLA